MGKKVLVDNYDIHKKNAMKAFLFLFYSILERARLSYLDCTLIRNGRV